MDSRILHYEFVTGESVNITVSAEIAEVIYDSRRMEHASNERSRYHTAFSLDSEDYEGTNLVSEKTPDDLMETLTYYRNFQNSAYQNGIFAICSLRMLLGH